MVKSTQIGQLFSSENLPWTRALNAGNIAESRAVPAPPSAAPTIPFEGGFSP
jgi:hypothetical protein